MDLIWHDRKANHQKAARLLEADPPVPGSLVVLPEAFPVGFTMKVDEVADRDNQTGQFLIDLAKRYAVTVVGGNIIKPDDLGRNIALVVGPDGRVLTTYEKIHPFSFAGENRYFQAGDRVVWFDCGGGKISPMICYDLRFPEVFRLAVCGGAEVIVVIANWPTARVSHWLALLTARAIENQAYVIGCNRCGSDPYVAYPGRSVVIDPQGKVLVDAGDCEGVIQQSLDLKNLREYRESFPALRDIRFMNETNA
jgi:predicted amidohydrolase